MRKVFLVAAATVFCASAAAASEKVDGTFTAVRDCEAYQSFSKGSNPGVIKVKPGEQYDAEEINKAGDWNWIRVNINGATPNLRWVSKECGTTAFNGGTEPPPTPPLDPTKPSADGKCTTPNQYDSYVLAMTWQPGFCEHPPRPSKPECKDLNEGKLSISHLTLHGLWPNKKDCGTSYGKCGNTPLSLEEDTLAELAPWMPNCYFTDARQCNFADYEWRKHGTCQERDDDTYFKLAIDILQRVDKSEIGKYLKDNIGDTISVAAYRQHIEESMGKEVADRLRLVCAQGKYLQEVRMNLPKVITVDDDISKMVAGAEAFSGKFAPNCSDEIHIERSGRE